MTLQLLADTFKCSRHFQLYYLSFIRSWPVTHLYLDITDITENIKKEICRIFNANGLRITIEANKQVINFLDVTFNLSRNTFQPYTKPNTTLQYVHHESNHPPITTKNIPAGINRRLSSLSSDKASFDQAAPAYQKATTTWVNFCRVCAAGLSEPVPHYSLFCVQLKTPS